MNSNFKKTDIGLIPEDWNIKLIDNYFDLKQGKQLSKMTEKTNFYYLNFTPKNMNSLMMRMTEMSLQIFLRMKVYLNLSSGS